MNRRQMLSTLGGTAAALASPTLLLRQVEAGGPSAAAYQRVWDADQSHRGVPAIGLRERGDKAVGFVKVDEGGGQDPGHHVIAEVVLPDDKRETYDLTKALLDNYRLDQTKREDTTFVEAQETISLLEAVTDSAPMEAVKGMLGDRRGDAYTRDEFQNLL
ncbi:MAG: hypothetical protein R3F54_01520, partial [Alphaproteobacteria bacterium]